MIACMNTTLWMPLLILYLPIYQYYLSLVWSGQILDRVMSSVNTGQCWGCLLMLPGHCDSNLIEIWWSRAKYVSFFNSTPTLICADFITSMLERNILYFKVLICFNTSNYPNFPQGSILSGTLYQERKCSTLSQCRKQ